MASEWKWVEYSSRKYGARRWRTNWKLMHSGKTMAEICREGRKFFVYTSLGPPVGRYRRFKDFEEAKAVVQAELRLGL